MSEEHKDNVENGNGTRELLLASGYAERAIDYFLRKPNMGSIADANQVTELTGPCGDTMRCYLKLDDQGRIQDARYQVLGCPGAVSAAMALVDIIRGKTLDEALSVKDRDVFRELVEIPDQKQHCIRLAVKTLEKAIREYTGETPQPMEGIKTCPCSTSSACSAAK
ncbi:MAG: iron-sulfur cluster assembly scaffold protein [Deltaproteobacteria bacterium]|nr:iron-sulfur cluster assembly scaffold protein [Deltaproteobacteria bacterium]